MSETCYRIAIGWSTTEQQEAIDLDLSCFLLTEENVVRSNEDIVFYNQLDTPDGCVQHLGDHLGESSDGDDDGEEKEIDLSPDTAEDDQEVILVYPKRIPNDIHELVITVSIYEAAQRKQNFGMVDAAYIRLVDSTNEQARELTRYNLKNAPTESTLFIFGSFRRSEKGWVFRSKKLGSEKALRDVAHLYGLEIE